jgi:phosphoribosylformylglycinamidine (FGAM) synthase-like enzyme
MEPKRVLSNESQERYIGVFPVEDIEDLKKQAAKFGAPIHVI